LVARRKGIVTLKDQKERLKFAKEMRNKSTSYWRNNVAFYFDAVSFVYKTNPLRESTCPKGKIWRRKDEGLAPYCTSRGTHVGSGGKVLHMAVAITYEHGVILCKPYVHMDGQFFSNFITNNFKRIFKQTGKKSKIYLQDGDPSQNSASARIALKRLNAKVLSIPPRSPDLNPIENLFAYTKKELRSQAFKEKITRETYKIERISEKHYIYTFNKCNVLSIKKGIY